MTFSMIMPSLNAEHLRETCNHLCSCANAFVLFSETVTEDYIWHHFVTVTIPDVITYDDAAMLYISGGNKNEV